MNKQRREWAKRIADELREIQPSLDAVRSELEELRNEEEETYENIPENLQEGGRALYKRDNLETFDNILEAMDAFDIDTLVNDLLETTEPQL